MTVREALEMTDDNVLVDIYSSTACMLNYAKTLLQLENTDNIAKAILDRNVTGIRKESDRRIFIDC